MERWNLHRRDPFNTFPLTNPRLWRKNRGLQENGIFAIFESGNFLLDKNEGTPIVRSIFYLNGAKNLLNAARDSHPTTKEEWEKFVEVLRKGRHHSWPTEEKPSSISFLVQFTQDILYCMMGMQSAIMEPWSTALLMELGEFRRVGNKYSCIDTIRAVESFKQILNKYKEECV
jgi:hypothetical protein